jgi:RNA polymerase sigma-70 factor (ECF subfamily)
LKSWIDVRLGPALRQRVDVEDILQETSLQAVKSMSAFQWRGEESFLYWLSRIAENSILREADRQKRSKQIPLKVDLSNGNVSLSRAHRREERFDRLRKALDDLHPDHRKVILLSRLEGLSLREIAVRMNRTPNAVSHLLMRALRKLKGFFGETESFRLPPHRLNSEEVEHDE